MTQSIPRPSGQPLGGLSKKRALALVGLVVVAHILVQTLYLHFRSPNNPIGWDSPYYITQTKSFLEDGFLGNRVGLIALVAGLHAVLGVPLITLFIYVTVGLNTVLALVSGLLAYRAFRSKASVFLLVFMVVFWSQNSFFLTLSIYDNALGLALSFLALYFLSSGRSWKQVVPFAVATTLVVLTHFESFIFLMLSLAFFLAFAAISRRSLRQTVVDYGKHLGVMGAALVFAYFQWANIIQQIFAFYTRRGDPGLNASIPYASARSVSDILSYFSTGLESFLQFALFVIGSIALFRMLRRRNEWANALAAVFVSSYVVLLYSILRASIPINRSILLLPTALFIGIGLGVSLEYIWKRFRRQRFVGLLVVMACAAYIVPQYISLSLRYSSAIHSSVFAGYQDLLEYSTDQRLSHFVIVADTPTDERAASAFYGLWYYWAQAVFPLPTDRSTYCIYFGKYDQYQLGLPTVRADNEEYNSTSVESLRCLSSLPEGKIPVFMIRGIAPVEYPALAEAPDARVISPQLLRIE